MKFLIFALVIAFILEDYGTFQYTDIEKCTLHEKLELFKEYAIDLVSVAIEPLRRERHIMNNGSQCFPIAEEAGYRNPFILILATLSIAKDYHEGLELINKTKKLSKLSEENIPAGLRENIDKILIILDKSSVPPASPTARPKVDVFQKYLFGHEPSGAASGSAGYDYEERMALAMTCFQAVHTMDDTTYQNAAFFDGLELGFQYASNLMTNKIRSGQRSPHWGEIRKIIKQIKKYKLITLANYAEDLIRKELESKKPK